jgi:hypothetical protein
MKACNLCIHGMKFMDRRLTYWCWARHEKVVLTSYKSMLGTVCARFRDKAEDGESRFLTAADIRKPSL